MIDYSDEVLQVCYVEGSKYEGAFLLGNVVNDISSVILALGLIFGKKFTFKLDLEGKHRF